jgi:NADP-dependent 3-hydroxy acid dehydrogenase YdfG
VILAGRVALVTGASRGIGAAVATGLALAAARVVLVARSGERLAEVAAGLPGGAVAMPADLSVAGAVDALVAAVREQVGVPDIVILNAGAFDLGAVGELSLGTLDRMVDLNLRSPYRLLHHLIPGMRARGTGHLVTIGSIADHVAFPGNGAYALTKYGIRGLHEVVREELRGSGVRATLVSPGPVDTPIWDPLHPESRPGFPVRSEMLRADDVADAVLWAVGRPVHVNVDEVRLGRS